MRQDTCTKKRTLTAELEKQGLEQQLCHSPIAQPEAIPFSSGSLNFPSCKVGIMPSQDWCEEWIP